MDNYINEIIYCSISQEIFYDPVSTDDGQVYERDMIEKWLLENNTSPMTNKKISKKLIPCYAIKNLVDHYLIQNPELKEKQYVPIKNFILNENEIYEIVKERKFESLLKFKNFYLFDHKKNEICFIELLLKDCKIDEIIEHTINNSVDIRGDYKQNLKDEGIIWNIFQQVSAFGSLNIFKYLYESKKKDCGFEYYTVENIVNELKLLYVASKYNNLEMVKFFLENKVDINKGNLTILSFGSYTPFHAACEMGNNEIVKLLAENNCDMHLCSMYSFPIYEAFKNCSFETIMYLIERGADIVNISKHKGGDVINALFKGKLNEKEIVKIIDYYIEKKIHIILKNIPDGYTSHPHQELPKFSFDFIKEIFPKLNKIIDPSAYHICNSLLSSKNEELVKFVINNTNFNKMNIERLYYGYSPVYYIIRNQPLHILKYFIEKTNPNLKIKSHGGDTPLDFARKWVKKDKIKYLEDLYDKMDKHSTKF